MPQQHERQDQINQTHPATHGFAGLSISVNRWVFLHPDTLYSNLCQEDPQEETLQEEEAAEDSQEEETLEEEAADSPAEEDLYKVILKEDHQEIDS